MSFKGPRQGTVPFRQGILLKILLSPLGILYRIWTFSIRFKYEKSAGASELKGHEGPLVIFLWHNRLFLAGEWHRRFRRQNSCYGLISASRDGAWLETFYGWANIQPIRGSQNRRGSQALRELVKVVREGNDVGITPDGSRGPKYEAKAGAVALARITKMPVLLLSFEYSKFFSLNSWDNFIVPFPFSKVVVRTRILSKTELHREGNDQAATDFATGQLLEITYD